jgi:hypothetical protein
MASPSTIRPNHYWSILNKIPSVGGIYGNNFGIGGNNITVRGNEICEGIPSTYPSKNVAEAS